MWELEGYRNREMTRDVRCPSCVCPRGNAQECSSGVT